MSDELRVSGKHQSVYYKFNFYSSRQYVTQSVYEIYFGVLERITII